MLVVRDGEALHRASYGVTSVTSAGLPADLHTPFYVASMANMFTAAAVLVLAEEGRIDLGDEIGEYLTGIPKCVRPLTVAQLLTHLHI